MALPVRVSRSELANPFNLMQREFDNMLSRFFGGQEAESGIVSPPFGVDIREDADHIYVEAELPGFKKEDVDIRLENQTLTISAEKHEEQQQPQAGQQQKGDYLLQERRYRRFERSFTLPTTIDDQQVNAKLQDGVLSVTLNKREESKPRRIPVS